MDAIYSFDYSILNYINEHFHNAFFDGFFSIITHHMTSFYCKSKPLIVNLFF